ncbi:zinc finger HIT domain-containing protein 3 [Diorhabda carinulata]|uniref:zinc finger HIT domain-containing protein 3 n=1 Tax=Diorhabda sublineata TaxID=1163346 RepID=UPI0024E0EFC9|nr:zinc finger HIT domain-containing protein 3 [Diorhabda sublineata]XP_057654287.1 zinc finger HIT domain-containing protein 3 [Diorhabda carinulata]
MNKTCEICSKEARYKCPTCMIFYCSVPCCKIHRQNKCDVLQRDEEEEMANLIVKRRKIETMTESTVPEDKLKLLNSNEEVNNLLTNSHLRNLLVAIDKSDNAEEVMQKAMQEPIFVEFADACLKVVEDKTEVEENS